MSELPIGNLPASWRVVKLGDVCSKIGSGATPRGGGAVYVDEGIAFIRSQNVYDNEFSDDGLVHIDDEAAEQLKGVAVQQGDVLLNITGDSILRTCCAPVRVLPARVSQHVAIIRPKHDLDSLFLQKYLTLPSVKEYMLGHSAGGTRKAITKGHIQEFLVPVPPVEEQRAIAGVLGALDDKIESNRRLVDILRQNARVVAENACSNGERRRLDGIAVFQRGFGYKSSGFAESGRPMISMGCSERRGWLRRDKVRTYGDAVKEKYFVRAEQLLIVNVDLTWKLDVLGWPLLVPPDLDEAIISNDIFGVQFAEGDEWLSWVVWAELQTWSARSVIEGGAKGTTVASVGVDTLGQVEIRIPDSAIGRSTAETMSAFLRRAWTAEEESVQLTTLRDALLPELLSGRLRVRDAEKVVEDSV